MTAIQANLTAIGFKIKIQQMDGASWTKRNQDGDFQMSFEGAQNGPDGNIAATYFLSTSAYPQGDNGFTGYHYTNPQADQLIQQGVQSSDPATRATTYQQLCKVLADDLPWNVMWQTTRYWIVNTRIGNMVSTPGAGSGTFYDAAETWYIKQ
jgi:peptide/nickel transport system substrate-binding protein